MQSKMCIRVPLKMPHQTFGEAFSSDNLTFDNIQTGYFMILSGNRVGEETGTAKITVDGIRKDGTVIEGIPFSKKQDDIFKYTEVKEDEIKIEDCPVWLEYMITSRMVTKLEVNRIRLNISAVQNSLTPCCVIVEGTDLRYSSEVPFLEENDSADNNGSSDETGVGDETGNGTGDGTGDGNITEGD